jgi:integrase
MENDHAIRSILSPKPFRSWNKGKFIGPKVALTPRYVRPIRARLQLDGKIRDLALFNLAIDSKLRGCDLVSLKVDDVAPNGYTSSRATVRQRKTGQPVRFEITEQTRQTVDAYLRAQPTLPGHRLFPVVGGRHAR